MGCNTSNPSGPNGSQLPIQSSPWVNVSGSTGLCLDSVLWCNPGEEEQVYGGSSGPDTHRLTLQADEHIVEVAHWAGDEDNVWLGSGIRFTTSLGHTYEWLGWQLQENKPEPSAVFTAKQNNKITGLEFDGPRLVSVIFRDKQEHGPRQTADLFKLAVPDPQLAALPPTGLVDSYTSIRKELNAADWKCEDQIAGDVFGDQLGGQIAQWLLLHHLGKEGRQTLEAEAGMRELLVDASSLRLLLLSGGAGKIREQSNRADSKRWEEALRVLCMIRRKDPRSKAVSLYMKLAVATCLNFCHGLENPKLWERTAPPIDPLLRYEMCCRWAESAAAGQESPYFRSFCRLSAFEMRYVVISPHDETEQRWAFKTFSNQPHRREKVIWACHQEKIGVKYRDTNSRGVSVHSEKYYGGRPLTLMEYNKTGGVCGAQSFYTTGVCHSHGIPAFPVALEGHCAYMTQQTPGKWILCNQDNSRNTYIHDKYPEIQYWGRNLYAVVLYQSCLTNHLQAFITSETLCALVTARDTDRYSPNPLDLHWSADKLSQATDLCPANLGAWTMRLAHLRAMWAADVNPDQSSWVEHQFAKKLHMRPPEAEVVSRGRTVTSCTCEDTECQERRQNLVDLIDTEWWTSAASAWVQIDLGEPVQVKNVKIKWWGHSVSEDYTLLSSIDGINFEKRGTHASATKNPKGPFAGGQGDGNGLSELDGWKAPARHIRLQMTCGNLDPWGLGKRLGIRNFDIIGVPVKPHQPHRCCAIDMLETAVRCADFSGGTDERRWGDLAREDLLDQVREMRSKEGGIRSGVVEISFGEFASAPAAFSWEGEYGVHDGGMEAEWICFQVGHVRSGMHSLSVAYASGDPRLVDVRAGSAASQTLKGICTDSTTGFGGQDIQWFHNVGEIELGPPGVTVVEFKAQGFLPHMAKFKLTPV